MVNHPNRSKRESPSDTEIVAVGERFVAKDGDRWYIMQNTDYQDRDGNMGMRTEILGDPHGYDTREAANFDLDGGFQASRFDT